MSLRYCLVLLTLRGLTWAMKLVNTSQAGEAVQVAIEGQSMEMSCLVDYPWHECYWMNLRDNQTRYQTTQSEPANIRAMNDHSHISFIQDEFRCGLHIDNVRTEESGTWKCHMADEGLADSNAVEGFTQVNVASPAHMAFTSSLDDDQDKETVLGEQLDLKCSLVDDDVFPLPTISILKGSGRLMANRSNTTELKYTKTLTMDDDDNLFLCELMQTLNGEVLHREISPSNIIRLVYPPKLVPSGSTNLKPYAIRNGTLEIPFLFSARPVPNAEDVIMTILDEDGQEKERLTAGNACQHYRVSAIQPILDNSTDHGQYFFSVQIKSLSHVAAVIVKISNPHGELAKKINLEYMLPPPQPSSLRKATIIANQAGIPLYLLLLTIIFVLLAILSLFCCHYCCSWRRRRSEDKHDTAADNTKADLNDISDKKVVEGQALI